MADSKAWVNLALRELSCNQKELAQKIGVSTGQVSKWKKHGEHMSVEIKDKFKLICPIDDFSPEFVLDVGSLEAANQWQKVINFLAQNQNFDTEENFGFSTRLTEFYNGPDGNWELEKLTTTLNELGFVWPQKIALPKEFDNMDDGQEEALFEIPSIALISDIFESYAGLTAFYDSYFAESFCDETFDEGEQEFECNLFNLAACKLEENLDLCPNFQHFKFKWVYWYKNRIILLKTQALKGQVALKEELLNFVYDSAGELLNRSEMENMGILNRDELHPDIYMNEHLQGMREIQKVLPAIMEKLDIKMEVEDQPLI